MLNTADMDQRFSIQPVTAPLSMPSLKETGRERESNRKRTEMMVNRQNRDNMREKMRKMEIMSQWREHAKWPELRTRESKLRLQRGNLWTCAAWIGGIMMAFVITVQIYIHPCTHSRACVFYWLRLKEVKQTYTPHCCALQSLPLFFFYVMHTHC